MGINNFNNPNTVHDIPDNNFININNSNELIQGYNNIDSIAPQISTKESFNSLNGLQTNPPIPNIKEDLNLNIMEEEILSYENNNTKYDIDPENRQINSIS